MESANRKLFIGISIPYEELTGFPEMLKKLQIFSDKREYVIRWVPSDNLHVSLQYLGNISKQDQIAIEKKLNSFLTRLRPFRLDVRNVDATPSIAKGKTVWMGVRASGDLMGTQKQIREYCNEVFPEENQDNEEFKPHIIFSRLRNNKHLGTLLDPFLRKKFATLEVSEICLFETKMHNRIPIYNKLKTWSMK